MGLFDFFKKRTLERMPHARSQMWHTPSYFSYANHNIYESDAVQQAIRCILQEVRKLEPKHIKRDRGRNNVVYDSIQATLEYPNELMTASDFIEKIVYNLFINYNSFILPVWRDGELDALYPLQPSSVDFLQDASNTLFVKFCFENGYESTIRYSDVIHIRYNYGASEFMGGDVQGNPDVKALQKSVNLNEDLLYGIQKSIKSSYAVNGVVKYNTMMDDGKTAAALAELTEKLNNNENGFMSLDLKGEFIPLSRDIKIVDEATLKLADEKILRYFGVSLPILTGDFTTEQYAAFFQKSIEPLIVSMNQAFTKSIFTKKGSTKDGHKIIFYHNKLDMMSITQKKEVGVLLSDTGSICVDELRDMFGIAPCDDEELGKTLIMSKNYGDAKSVKNQVDTEAEAIKALASSNKNDEVDGEDTN